MVPHQRMSPFTAFFLGLFGLGAVGLVCGAAVVVYTLNMLDGQLGAVVGVVGKGLENLPALMENLPPAAADVLADRRDPNYRSNIDVEASLVYDERREAVRPVVTVTNRGGEMVTLLAIRVVALDSNKRPIAEWTEVAATPLAIDDEWRGPLAAGETRHVLAHARRCGADAKDVASLATRVEVGDIRVWAGAARDQSVSLTRVP